MSSTPQLPLFPGPLRLVHSRPIAEDDEVRAALAEMHWKAAQALREDGEALMTRFPGSAYAEAEAAALRRESSALLRSARALGGLAGIELRELLSRAV